MRNEWIVQKIKEIDVCEKFGELVIQFKAGLIVNVSYKESIEIPREGDSIGLQEKEGR